MSQKVMLITGGSRGIGAEIAKGAAKQGYFVIINFTKGAKEAQGVVDQIKGAGGDAVAIQADCSQEDEIVRLFKEADQYGNLEAFIANAGIIGGQNPVTETTFAQLRELFDINVIGLMISTREAVKRMSTAHGGNGGKIVLMSSVAARTGGIAQEIHYAASKAAVDGFLMGLAKEVGNVGIRVNAVRPGLIGTSIHDLHGGREVIEKWGAGVPMGRIGEPTEVAQTVLWLCSDQSSYVHGTLIDVSGGR
jgi:NAD(P)-dependent dehydrogenase (short-subunit alcohol dehydrogenase family)